MERAWLFENLAVTVTRIDFIDPAVAHEDDARERGVRMEIRRLDATASGTVYVSPAIELHPALCRFDLLESRPGAADRMHWHPGMTRGEPGRRTFDDTMPSDPQGWVRDRLGDLRSVLPPAERDDPRYLADVAAVAAAADEIVVAVREGLAWAREPWPDIDHDERGMATAV
jgi:hypothetical protein